MMQTKPRLYIHVGQATHFLRWELSEFAKYFELVEAPDPAVPMLVFGPDVMEAAGNIPASVRFLVTFPGFGHNPLHDPGRRRSHTRIIKKYYDTVFINPGPLELAYAKLDRVQFYPFSVDTRLVTVKKYRTRLNSLVHVSNDGAQKDWERSLAVMKATGLKYDLYPPRKHSFYMSELRKNSYNNFLRKVTGRVPRSYLPYGYVAHEKVVRKYQSYDGFVHVADDVRHKDLLDGKYTASLIEAGLTGSLLFWHDTFGLGNNLETVFDLSVDPDTAARQIIDIRDSVDIKKHSQRTREEMLETFSVERSVGIRANYILDRLRMLF